MTDTGYPPRDWVCIHTMLWKEQQGPIPTGHVLIFRDGDKTNIVIDNLKLISRKELARRNSIHNLPEPLRETIRAKGVLTRKINQHEKQNRRSSGSSVRDH